jgi:excisionase family DNA binding protein
MCDYHVYSSYSIISFRGNKFLAWSGRMAKQCDVLLTVPEAARELGLKPKTIRVWIGARKIGVVRLGSSVKIKTSEVERLIRAGTQPALGQGGAL